MLLIAACDWACEQRATALSLWIVSTNERARRFYQRHSFRLTGERTPLPEGEVGTNNECGASGRPRSNATGSVAGRARPATVVEMCVTQDHGAEPVSGERGVPRCQYMTSAAASWGAGFGVAGSVSGGTTRVGQWAVRRTARAVAPK